MLQPNRSDPPVLPSPWRPLRIVIFRNLLIADLVSDIGTFMQSVGAAWLMTSLSHSPLYIALIQTASALPFFLLALPAGSIGDICDRRRLILGTEVWMFAIAAVLAVTTISGVITPWLLLLLTFSLSMGDAIEAPTWRAILPELVNRDDLSAALALNGIEFNLARAVGPGLAGLIIAATGVAVAFTLNALSFLGVILVIARWKRPARKSKLPVETLRGASSAAVRYVRYSPGIRTLLLRSACLVFFASSFWALLPMVAKELSKGPIAYGLLLGFFGAGAVLGAVELPRARSALSMEAIISVATATFAAVILSTATLRSLDGVHVPVQHDGSEPRTRLGPRAGAGSLPFCIPRQHRGWQYAVGVRRRAHQPPHDSLNLRRWNRCMPAAAIRFPAAQHRSRPQHMESLGQVEHV